MAISYHIVKRIEPGVPGGGHRKYYAKAIATGRLDMPEIISRIERRSTLNGADIRGVIYALSDIIKEGLAEGSIVEIGEIGTFRVSLKSTGRDHRQEVGTKSIEKVRVIYKPDAALNNHFKRLVFRKL